MDHTLDICESSVGVLGVTVDRAAALRVDPLSDAITDVERIVAQTQSVITDAREAFALLQKTLHPDADPIGSIRELVQAFSAGKHPLYDFGREKMSSSIKSAFTIGLAHGEVSEANLQKITSSMPRNADGSWVSLRPLSKVAKQYAAALIETIEKSKSSSAPSPSVQPGNSSKPSEFAQARAQ